MRILIISADVYSIHRYWDDIAYDPPSNVQLDIADPNQVSLKLSLFDYDVSVIHIQHPKSGDYGYYHNLPKIMADAKIALTHGRTVICLPQSKNFTPIYKEYSSGRTYNGMTAYHWLNELGITLQDNFGVAIELTPAGRAQAVDDYIRCCPSYHQIITEFENSSLTKLAIVAGTDILVGMELPYEKGTLVVLPSADFSQDGYTTSMTNLMNLAQRYYERAQRKVTIGDAPRWIEHYIPDRAKELDNLISELSEEKTKYEQIAYALYGTGGDLEDSVNILLTDLGLKVEPQPKGANVDQRATHPTLGLGFSIEITGTTGVVNKKSSKIGQSHNDVIDRTGTPESDYRLMVIANTECGLDPKDRNRPPFSPNAVKLLSNDGALLITTLQLYKQWKDVHESRKSAEDVVNEWHSAIRVV